MHCFCWCRGHLRHCSSGSIQTNASKEKKDENTQLFEVKVPCGIQPGQPFSLLAGGQWVLVTCPFSYLPIYGATPLQYRCLLWDTWPMLALTMSMSHHLISSSSMQCWYYTLPMVESNGQWIQVSMSVIRCLLSATIKVLLESSTWAVMSTWQDVCLKKSDSWDSLVCTVVLLIFFTHMELQHLILLVKY